MKNEYNIIYKKFRLKVLKNLSNFNKIKDNSIQSNITKYLIISNLKTLKVLKDLRD